MSTFSYTFKYELRIFASTYKNLEKQGLDHTDKADKFHLLWQYRKRAVYGGTMYLVKYWNSKTKKHEYRKYCNKDEYQVRKIVNAYSRRHGLLFISITKEY